MRSFHTCLFIFITSYVSAQSRTNSLLIHFPFNSSAIDETAATRLDSLLRAVEPGSISHIRLAGHCDFIGSDRYNDSLSLERVSAVKQYLIARGIAHTQFDNESGLGKRVPLLPATTDAARAVNRRVQLVFTRQDAETAKAPDPTSQAVEVPTITETVSNTGLSARIRDTATRAGSILILPDLNFEPGRHFLLPGSYAILRDLYRAMKDNPQLQIEIHGHICCISGGVDGEDIDTGAPDLSVQRAKAIYQYLVSAGIAASRMQYKGFGSSQKLFPAERTPEEQSKNRRVEIKIVFK